MAPLRQIENGTFAGECIVDCFETIAVTPTAVAYSLTSRFPDNTHPDVRAAEPMDEARWNQLASLVDVDGIAALPSRIGLPNGADTGGEFVTVATDRNTKRVEFESDNVPGPLEPCIGRLRELRAELAARHGR